MSEFHHGLDDKFISVLRNEASQRGWWRDVLTDTSLVLGIRNGYMNVYWLGQSIFKIRLLRNALVASTHSKFLLNPSLSGQVNFDGEKFDLREIEASSLIRNYAGPSTLQDLKKAASVYANGEKIGVHAIATLNASVVDVEIAFSAVGYEGVGKFPRLDIAAFEESGDTARLVFWEAKLFGNNDLKADDDNPAVLGQIAKYRLMIAAHKDSIVTSYSRVAANLSSLADMSDGARAVPDFIREVGLGQRRLILQDPADIGLIIFGFDQAQRDHALWQNHLGTLRTALDGARIKTAGNAKNINL